MPKRNKSWENEARKNATEPPDQKRLLPLKEDFQTGTGVPFFIWPDPPNGINRNPDGKIKIDGYTFYVELDGPQHGFGDDVSESKQTRSRNDDYVRNGHFPIIVNEQWLKNQEIEQIHYVKSVVFFLEQICRARKRLNRAVLSGDLPKVQSGKT